MQMTNTNQKYAPLATVSAMFGIPVSSLKIKMTLATKRGIPLPSRARVGKSFLYDTEAFGAWLFENADALRQTAPIFEKKQTKKPVERANT